MANLDERIASLATRIGTEIAEVQTTKADDIDVVKLSGAQTITGQKTFSTVPKVEASSGEAMIRTTRTDTGVSLGLGIGAGGGNRGIFDYGASRWLLLYQASDDFDGEAGYAQLTAHPPLNSSSTYIPTTYWVRREIPYVAVSLTGTQTVAGVKTFSSRLVDTAYFHLDASADDPGTTHVLLRATGAGLTAAEQLIAISTREESGAYGLGAVFGSGGNSIFGAGEGKNTLHKDLVNDTGENAYVCADSDVRIVTNAQTYDNRGSVRFTSSSDSAFITHAPRITETYKGDTPTVDPLFETILLDSTDTNSGVYRLATCSLLKTTVRNAAELRAYTDTSGSNTYESISINAPVGGGTAYTHAPTPASGDSSTKIATTAWVNSAISSAVADLDNGLTETASTIAQTGYIKLENGLLLQWGRTSANMSGGGSYTVSLPTSFSSASSYVVVLTPYGTSYSTTAQVYTQSASSFGVTVFQSTDATVYMQWLAIGY